MLVYVGIAVSGVALLALAIGALVKRKELFGSSTSAEPQLARPEPAAVHVSSAPPAPQAVPWGAAVPVASTWPSAAAPQPFPPQPHPQPQPVTAQPADVATTAWGSGIPAQTARPAERLTAAPRRPAAFTPRPPAGPPSPAPAVPSPSSSAWEWRPDAPATQELPRIGAAPAAPAPAAATPAPAAAAPPPAAAAPAPAAPPAPA